MWKFCCWVWSEVCSANQITEFLKQLNLKKDEVNQSDVLYIGRDSGKVNRHIKISGKVCSFL